MNSIEKDLVPEQTEGSASDIAAMHECKDDTTASAFYQVVKKRLLNVNGWEKIAGLSSADFKLFDSSGKEVRRDAQKGDHFRIDVPGPGPVTGDGYDWVRVEEIKKESNASSELVAITVRPVANPLNDSDDVAHFFDDSATSTFIVKREGKEIIAEIHGRNEKPNTDPEKVIDKIRNTAMATAAVAGISRLQWKGLAEGLVRPEDL